MSSSSLDGGQDRDFAAAMREHEQRGLETAVAPGSSKLDVAGAAAL